MKEAPINRAPTIGLPFEWVFFSSKSRISYASSEQ